MPVTIGTDPDSLLSKYQGKLGGRSVWNEIARVSNEMRDRGYSWSEIHEILKAEGYEIPDFEKFRNYASQKISNLGLRTTTK